MLVSYQWLKKWVNLDVDPQKLGDSLTSLGLEVSSITKLSKINGRIVVGEIVDYWMHPGKSNLTICMIDVGRRKPIQIICGAKNISKGIKVATALSGAKISSGQTIRKKTIHDFISAGMLVSANEIGLEDEVDGILWLDDSAEVGISVNQHLSIDDYILDIDLTPDRGDCLSVLGIAREVSVIYDLPITDNVNPNRRLNVSSLKKIDIEVASNEQCPRYLGRVIENIQLNKPTPDWMRESLRRSGLRTINPIVDVTNFVMLELGQPLHAFDLKFVEEGITVRNPFAREQLTLLDGKKLVLRPQTLVIANKKRPVGLAGIMGGKKSGVTKHTDSIFLEAAYFNPDVIRRGASEYGLQTDASYRFERGVDPEQQRRALERASNLLIEICSGKLGPITEVRSTKDIPRKKSIRLTRNRLDKVLGTRVPTKNVTKILSGLNMTPIKDPKGWKVKPPQYRFDLDAEHDLIEEIARVYGFDNLTSRTPRIIASSERSSEKTVHQDILTSYLINRDFNEVVTYSFVDSELQSRLGFVERIVKIKNPIASNMNVMRQSLWPGLLAVVGNNYRRQYRRIRLFEIGNVFFSKKHAFKEEKRIGGVVTGSSERLRWDHESSQIDFFDVKGVIEGLLALDGKKVAYNFEPTSIPSLHPGQSAEICYRDQLIGFVGMLSPSIQKYLEIDPSVYLFEINLDFLKTRAIPSYCPISRFPSVTRDLSILVKQEDPAGKVEQVIRSNAGNLVTSISLFDVYSGEGVKKTHKSLSFSLTFQSSSRNLTEKEVETVFERIVTALKEIGADLRPG